MADLDEFPARTGHASVYCVKFDVLVLFGGYDLNQVLDDMLIYHFNTSTWEKLNTSSVLPRLFGHAMAMINDEEFAIFGGETQNNSVNNQLYKFNIASKMASVQAEESDVKPPGLSKHTLTLVRILIQS